MDGGTALGRIGGGGARCRRVILNAHILFQRCSPDRMDQTPGEPRLQSGHFFDFTPPPSAAGAPSSLQIGRAHV